jgi:hypothetical protein
MRSRGSPGFAPNGEITRWYGSVEDINDRKLQDLQSCQESEKQHLEDHVALAKGIVLAESLLNSNDNLLQSTGGTPSSPEVTPNAEIDSENQALPPKE